MEILLWHLREQVKYITITDASNGNIALAPEGTGEVVVGSGSAAGDITSSGAYDLILDTNSGTNAGNITLTDGANGNIEFTNNGTGVVKFNVKFNDAAYYPEADLTFDASQDWDVQASPVAKVTLTANVITRLGRSGFSSCESNFNR